MKVQLIKIEELKPNEHNPRIISEAKLNQLMKSLQNFPEMSIARPIIINQDNVVIGGNMRLKAMGKAGWIMVPTIKVDWSEEKQREFVIKDNNNFGEWDWEILSLTLGDIGTKKEHYHKRKINISMGKLDYIIGTIQDTLSTLQIPERVQYIEQIKEALHHASPLALQPINLVRWVPIDKVQANDYNPNSVAGKEMGLLYTSIKHDGYTQPIVTIYDGKIDKYIIVDGFHRYFTCKSKADILERNLGLLPIVVLNSDINNRMASTVRHNRARGEHSINGMSNMVYEMLKNGWQDHDICNELGMEPEELLKLKHITGFSKLFKDKEFTNAWKSKEMIQIEKKQGLI